MPKQIPIERVEELVTAAYAEGMSGQAWLFSETRAALLRLKEEVSGE